MPQFVKGNELCQGVGKSNPSKIINPGAWLTHYVASYTWYEKTKMRLGDFAYQRVTVTTQQINEGNGSARLGSSLVLVGHGSTVNPDSSRPTWDYVDRIRQKRVFVDVVCGFWKEEPSLREVLRTVETDEIYVVPHFTSEGYFTQKVIPRELGLAGPITRRNGRTIKYCEPVGSHPRMTELLLQQVTRIARIFPRSDDPSGRCPWNRP